MIFLGLWFTVKNFFTGLLPLIWHFGSAGVVAFALLAFYFAAPAWFLPGLRKIALWIVLAIGVYLLGLTIGVKDEAGRCRAQLSALQTNEADLGTAARSEAVSSVPLVDVPADGRVRNKPIDRYDRLN